MATNVIANPTTRIIQVQKPIVNGVVTLDVESEVYSELKNDWKNDPILNKLIFPFRVIGGDDLGEGRKAGSYYFLRNDLGWRFKPAEDDQELVINGNLFANDVSSPLFLPTDGEFTVALRLNTSQLTQSIEGTGGAVVDINAIALATAQAVWDYNLDTHNTEFSTGNFIKYKLLRFKEWLSLKEK